jgi:hypothetical protein
MRPRPTKTYRRAPAWLASMNVMTPAATASLRVPHLVREDVLAEAAHGVLVLADGLEHAAPRALHHQVDDEAAHRDEHPADEHDPQLPVREEQRDRPEVEAVVAGREGVELLEAGAEAAPAVGAAEDVLERHRAEHQADDLRAGDRDDGQVIGPQVQRRDAEEQRQDGRRDEADDDAHPERQAHDGDRHGQAVAGHGHERRLAEVEQAGVAEVDVDADRGERVQHRLHADGRLDGGAENRDPVHCDPPPFSRFARGGPGCPGAGRGAR